MSQTFVGRHGWSVTAAAVVLVVYFVVFIPMPKHVFWSPDEGGKFLEVQSLHWNAGLTYVVPYVGRRIDPTGKFFPHSLHGVHETFPYPVTVGDRGMEFHWPIWFPLVSRLALAAFGMGGLYLLPLFSGWLIAVVSGRLTDSLAPRLAPAAILLVGFATPIFFFSLTFWEHTLATLVALLAITLLVAPPPSRTPRRYLLAALLLVAVALRLEMLALCLAVVVTWLIDRLIGGALVAPSTEGAVHQLPRRGGWAQHVLMACVAAGVLLLFVSSLTARHRQSILALPRLIESKLHQPVGLPGDLIAVVINAPQNEAPVVSPLWATAALVAVSFCFVAPLIRRAWLEAGFIVPALLVVIDFSGSLVFASQRYRSLHGLVPIAPFVVVWPYALVYAWRGRALERRLFRLAVFTLLYLATGVGAILTFHMSPEGNLLTGLEWGQRYLLTLYPVLTILSVVVLRIYWTSTRPHWLRVTFVSLVAAMMSVALLMEARGVSSMNVNRRQFAVWDSALRSEGAIITDVWWLPAALTELFTTHECYCVRSRAEVADWAALAAAHGLAGFTFASLDAVQDGQFATSAVRRIPERAHSVAGLYLASFEIVAADATRPPP